MIVKVVPDGPYYKVIEASTGEALMTAFDSIRLAQDWAMSAKHRLEMNCYSCGRVWHATIPRTLCSNCRSMG